MKVIKKILSTKGMTFVEVIAALGVLLTGVISGLTLTIFNLNTSVTSENKLLVANLAREAIEVIRQRRDSNWLANNDWFEGILQNIANNYRLIVKFDATPAAGEDFWTFEDQTAEIGNCSACWLYYDAANGVFSHNGNGEQTVFKRLITLNEICWEPMIEQETVLGNGQHCSLYNLEFVGWQITSQITWRDNNQDHELKIIDRIYDWY